MLKRVWELASRLGTREVAVCSISPWKRGKADTKMTTPIRLKDMTGRVCLLRAVCADRSQDGRIVVPDVVTQNDGNRCRPKQPLRGHGDDQPHPGFAGLYQESQAGTRQDLRSGLLEKAMKTVLPVPQEVHRPLHGLHAQEKQAEADKPVAQALLALASAPTSATITPKPMKGRQSPRT